MKTKTLLKLIWDIDPHLQIKYQKYGEKWKYIKLLYLPSFLLKKRTRRLMNAIKNAKNLIKYIEIPLTVNCTLNCKHCSNLMQYYPSSLKKTLDTQLLLDDIRILLENTNAILTLTLLGGEPFLYKDITDVIDLLISSGKVADIKITTNGTILPPDDFFKHIQGSIVRISISNYGELSTHKEEIINKLKKYHIPYDIGEEHKIWKDFGQPILYQRSEDEYKAQFKNCNLPCRSYYKGKLHYCPRSSHGTDLQRIPDSPKDYIDLNRKDMTPNLFYTLLKQLEQNDYIEACKYCKMGTDHLEEFPAAEQTPRL